MYNKQILVYRVFESTIDLGSVFVGQILFQETWQISKSYWNIPLLHDQAQEQEMSFLLIKCIDKNHFKKEKYWTTQF